MMTCFVYQVLPEGDVTYGSVLVKVNGASVLFNAPGGFQRALNSFQYGSGDLRLVVIEECKPELVEGLLGFLMTLVQTQAAFGGKIIIPADGEHKAVFDVLNDFALDPIFTGEILQCVDRLVVHERDFMLEVVNRSGKLSCVVSPSLESRSFDAAKLKEAGLKGKQMQSLTQNGFVELENGNRIEIDAVSIRHKCGCVCINHELPESCPDPSLFVATHAELRDTHLPSNFALMDASIGSDRFPARDFCEFYTARTGETLTSREPEPIVFALFPAKLYGPQQPERKKREPEDFAEHVFKQNIPPASHFIHTLGTGASVPNKYANVAATIIAMNGEYLLMDCGESTLQQLFYSPLKLDLDKIKAVLITHEHADHYLGLAVLLKRFEKNNLSRPRVICPRHVLKFLELVGVSLAGTQAVEDMFETAVQLTPAISIFITRSDHCDASVSYLIADTEELVYHSGDGRPIEPERLKALAARYQDLPLTIIHEATFVDEQEEAIKRKHATVAELIALKSQYGCKRMVLTHFSQRHCKEIIPTPEDVIQAFDFMVYSVPKK